MRVRGPRAGKMARRAGTTGRREDDGVADRGGGGGLAGGAAGHGGVAPRRLRRPDRPGRGRAPPARTTGRRSRSSCSRASGSRRTWRSAAADYDELELDLRLGVRATALDAAAQGAHPRRRRRDREELAVRRRAARHRRHAAHAPRHARPRRHLRAAHRRRRARPPRRASTPTRASSWSAPASSAPRWRRRAAGAASRSPCSKRCPRRSCAGSGETLGMVCGELHRDHGVDLRLGVGVAGDRGRRQRSSACGSTTAARSTPTSWWWAWASCRSPTGSRAPGSRSTTASCATRRCSRRRASSPPATSRAGRTRCSTAS